MATTYHVPWPLLTESGRASAITASKEYPVSTVIARRGKPGGGERRRHRHSLDARSIVNHTSYEHKSGGAHADE